jgi:hypothetical protein
MKARNTLLLAVLGAAVLAGGWWFGPSSQDDRRATVAAGTLVFPGLSAKLQNAARIEITNQGRTLVLAKGDSGWGIVDRGLYPVQQDKLREALTGLTELRITEARTSDPAQYARLGVDDPKTPTTTANLIRVLDGGGQAVAELIVGHRRVRTQGNLPESIYIRRPGEAQSWLAEGRLPVDADPQLWFDRDITNVAKDRIAGVVATRGATTLTFGRVDGKPALTAPAEHPKLDDYRVEEVFRSLESFTLSDVKPAADFTGEALGRSVLTTTDGVALTVDVFKGDKDIWVKLNAAGSGDAAKPAGEIQARVGKWAYQVGAWKEKAFIPTLDDLKAEEPEKPAAPTGSEPGAETGAGTGAEPAKKPAE